jgi:hypothetical protein
VSIFVSLIKTITYNDFETLHVRWQPSFPENKGIPKALCINAQGETGLTRPQLNIFNGRKPAFEAIKMAMTGL